MRAHHDVPLHIFSMITPKNILAGILIFLSILLGFTLGGINLYELISGAVKVNVILFLISISLVYCLSVCLFMLGLTDDKGMYKVYTAAAVVFGLTFFAISHNILGAFLSAGVFWWMQQYIYTSSKSRAALFVKFIPSEVFMPALRSTFVYLMIFFSLISFVQTRDKISQNTLVNDTLITFISKPFIPIVNKQLNSQVIQKLGSQYDNAPYDKKQEIATAVLREVVKNMADQETGLVYGIELSTIPFEDVYVYENGEIDIEPVFIGTYPQIKSQLFILLSQFGYAVPIIVAILVVLLIQPVFLVFGYIETGITLLLFWMLIKSNVLKKTLVDTKIERISL